ncbi:AAA family ATPase [Candidatus Daviesbacteria bacterium]|nr:AAA family ATPase [Candidatus Daviesbacteria bacterium]
MTNKFQSTLAAYNKASYALIYCKTPEELRATQSIQKLSFELGRTFGLWSVTKGWRLFGNKTKFGQVTEVFDITDPVEAMKKVSTFPKGAGIYVLINFHPFMKSPEAIQLLKDTAETCREDNVTLVFVSNVMEIPTELSRDFTQLDFSLPDEEELESRLNEIAKNAPTVKLPADVSPLIDAGKGMTGSEYSDALASMLVKEKKYNPSSVLLEKVKILEKASIRYYNSSLNLNDVGGLENLKKWAVSVKPTFGTKAKTAGVKPPKGVLLVGVPGCGKSYVMKAMSSAWGIPLLWGDISAAYSKFLGETEERMKYMFEVSRIMSPCILGIDELEKSIAGYEGGGQTSGGVPNRVLGIMLTEMQESDSSVVIVATANEAWKLPAPLVRRFDEVFFVDLPSDPERKDIFKIHLAKVKASNDMDIEHLSKITEGFSGAEIEKVCRKAQIAAFGMNQKISQNYVVTAVNGIVPVSTSMAEEVTAIRKWAEARAVPASKIQAYDITKGRRALDLSDGPTIMA